MITKHIIFVYGELYTYYTEHEGADQELELNIENQLRNKKHKGTFFGTLFANP